MTIRILDPNVAAKIAAGEVIERPVSVVKELTENSLDAGATNITIEIRNGGMELVQVSDNGHGIPLSEVSTAFERHATSKIQNDSDLNHISTLGFRGEALPSISAISDVILTTREIGSEIGAEIHYRGGMLVNHGTLGAAVGTIVSVSELFYNVPARRKFLRSQMAEGARVYTLVSQLALANPHVRFDLISNGRERFRSPGNGQFRDALSRVYSSDSLDLFLDICETDSDNRSTWGCVSAPSLSRPNRRAINFYVNGRWVQSRMLNQAVAEAYLGLQTVGRYPIVALHLEIPSDDIDVNVHPAKREVRFHKEGGLFTLVQRSVRKALVVQSPVPLVEPNMAWESQKILFSKPLPDAESSSKPAISEEGIGHQEQLVKKQLFQQSIPLLRVLGQISGTYIVAEGPSGLYLVDQHAAHERVLFEKVRRESKDGNPEMQGLLQPLPIELGSEEIDTIASEELLLQQHGFLGEIFGDRAYLLRGIPAGLRNIDGEMMFTEVLDLLRQSRDPVQASDAVAATIACHRAVRAGDTLDIKEMEELIRALETANNPQTCPHGRPTMLHVNSNDIEKEFGRKY